MGHLNTPQAGNGLVGGPIDRYVVALSTYDAKTMLATLDANAVYKCQFYAWPKRHVPDLVRARSEAFDSLSITGLIRDGDRAVIRWQASVSGTCVEAAEMLVVDRDAIMRVDLFIHPTEALETVRRSIVGAWPPKDRN